MEGTPLSVEKPDEEEERRKKEREEREARENRLKKPGNIGFFAVESEPPKPSPLEMAWAKTERPDEADGTEDEPPRPGTEIAPEPLVENLPETPATEPAEAPPPIPPPPVEILQPEPPAPEAVPAADNSSGEAASGDSGEPAVTAEPEASPEPETAPEPAPKVEAVPEPPAEQPEQPEPAPAAETADAAPPAEQVPVIIRPEAATEPMEEPDERPPEAVEVPLSAAVEAEENLRQPARAEEQPAPEPAPEAEPESIVTPAPERPPEPAAEEAEPTEPAKPAEAEPAREPQMAEHQEDLAAEKVAEPAAVPPAEQLAGEHAEGERSSFRFEDDGHEEDSDRPVAAQAESQASVRPVPVSELERSSRAAERRLDVEAAPKGPLAGRNVETLSQQEMLGVAEEIMIDGKSLKHAYETRVIGEHGLRRLLAEYQQGGDMREALRREILEHQIDFERDPAMRDMAMQGQPSDDTPKSETGDDFIYRLLQNSGEPPRHEAPGQETRSSEPPVYQTDDSHAWHSSRNRSKAALDALFISVISILFLLVIFIYISRH